MIEKTIYTLNARGNMLLEITKEYFQLNDEIMHSEITKMFNTLNNILKSKNLEYSKLKKCLIPQSDRKEIGLIFDTSKIKNNWYGKEIFNNIIPLFDEKSSHSILCGDYIGTNENQKMLYYHFFKEIRQLKDIEYKHSTQFYIVYINNLSNQRFNHFIENLKEVQSFIGYFNLTNQSPIKSLLSTMLINIFIKQDKNIIMSHEDDRNNNEDINILGYEFEESNFIIKSIQESYYGVFLSYKIEREIIKGFECDLNFSLNSMSSLISKIEIIEINEDKLEYLKTEKTGKLEIANLITYSKEELIDIIQSKINSNYIYNMTVSKEHNVLKFVIIIELLNKVSKTIKITIVFEYIPKEKKLRVITLY